jgi:hypothetical protein
MRTRFPRVRTPLGDVWHSRCSDSRLSCLEEPRARFAFVDIEIKPLNNPWGIMPETPFPESGMTVDNDLPDFPKSLHSVGTHSRRKTSIYQAFEGVLLMGEVSGISS